MGKLNEKRSPRARIVIDHEGTRNLFYYDLETNKPVIFKINDQTYAFGKDPF